MKIIYIYLILLITTFTSWAQQIVDVLPINQRQSTNLYIKKGDILQIEVTGEWSLWDQYPQVNGEGHAFKANDEYGNWGALLGTIGSGEPFLIGNGMDLTSDAEGVLYLFPNKGKYTIENESGKLSVAITGGMLIEDFISSELSDAAHYEFDPKMGTLLTDLYFEEGDSASIYAFGNWSMWEGVYPPVNADGHDFVSDGIRWGKLYLGIGSSTGQSLAAYSVGQKSDIKFLKNGVLSFFPYLSNYISSRTGTLNVYVVGGKTATEEEIAAADSTVSEYYSRIALEEINRYRISCSLPVLELNDELTLAAMDHAKYMVEHNSFSRSEMEENEFFTAPSPDDRALHHGYKISKVREMFCQTDTVENAVSTLFDTVYHRMRLMDPTLKHLGYGSYKKGDAVIHVFDFGYDAEQSAESDYFLYPGNMSKNIPVQWSGFEQPDPLPVGTVKPVGSPITALFKNPVEKILTSEMTEAETKNKIECFVISSETDINNRSINGVFMVPKFLLLPNTAYNVKVKVQYSGGEEKEIIWSFTTEEMIE